MRYVLFASMFLGAVLLVLLAIATGNTARLARYYGLLVGLNVTVAVALLGLVIYQLTRLVRALRKRRFGSRLTLRLMGLFCAMALLPGVLVYTVSVQFLAKSIESWFNVRVDNALESGLNLGRSMLDNMLEQLSSKGAAAALDLADLPPSQQPLALNRLREQTAADAVLLIGAQGVVASATRDVTRLVPDAPPTAILRQARQNRGYRGIEGEGERGLKLRVLVPLVAATIADESRMLQFTQTVPPDLAANAENVQSVHRDYRALQASREGLREIYIFSLTLTLLLTLFTAFALAFILSRRLSAPLATLAEGTAAVARGDFSRRAAVTSADELGILTASFNSMTEQLDEARGAAERNRRQVESAKAHLENVLASVSTGVLVLDRDLRVTIANAGAAQIFSQPMANLIGARLVDIPGFGALIDAMSAAIARSEQSPWQRQVEFADRSLVLVLRGSKLPAAAGGDTIVAFDDITALIQAQRATAWAEVAQRLAHEIKNPLTPIQLAAERLQVKLANRLGTEDAQLLQRSTDTIVAHVSSMKNMVDEFRTYARLPAPQLAAIDLNSVVNEVLTLYEHLRGAIRWSPGPGLPQIAADRSQLRQVIHNLLQNANDALGGKPNPRIEIASTRTEDGVCLTVLDNAGGFPEALLKRAFEPYVTTKPKGTGLGLAIVKKIIDEHHGRIALANWHHVASGEAGARMTIVLPLA